MKSSMFIPRKVRVGFQERAGTYTGKLAYVIYYDEKGKLRKEVSFDGWRDHKIPVEECKNEPTEGFVLNKNVGGYGGGYYSECRQAYIRVWDPRGWEFEIELPNLLYILQCCNCMKGKGLEGKFVYAWDGTSLVLLPVDSPDYKDLTKLNDIRFNPEKITAKSLVVGATYLTKDNREVVYLGRFEEYSYGYEFDGHKFPTEKKMEAYAKEHKLPLEKEHGYCSYYRDPLYESINGCPQGKKHFFYPRSKSSGMWKYRNFEAYSSVSGKFIAVVDPRPADDLYQLLDKLSKDTLYSPYDKTRDKIVPLSILDAYVLLQPRPFNDEELSHCFTVSEDGQRRGTVWVHMDKQGSSLDAMCKVSRDWAGSVNNIFWEIKKDELSQYVLEETIRISFREFYNAFQPCIYQKYLENGNLYKEES